MTIKIYSLVKSVLNSNIQNMNLILFYSKYLPFGNEENTDTVEKADKK